MSVISIQQSERHAITISAVGPQGPAGPDPEMQVSATHFQFKNSNQSAWQDIALKSDFKGDKGDQGEAIEIRSDSGFIQYKLVSEANWTNLYALEDLRGAKGDDGDQGDNGREPVLDRNSSDVTWRYQDEPVTAARVLFNLSEVSNLSHTHDISAITGLQAALNSRLQTGATSSFFQSLFNLSDAAALHTHIGLYPSPHNYIINGDFSVNQRGATTKAQNNGIYGYDRWRGHSSGLEQVVEHLEAGTYTLHFEGGGSGSIEGQAPQPSPGVFTLTGGAAISVVVPNNADHVCLLRGDTSDLENPFEKRHEALELMLCQRYYTKLEKIGFITHASEGNQDFEQRTVLPTTMRTAPSLSFGGTPFETNIQVKSLNRADASGFSLALRSVDGGRIESLLNQVIADSEF